MVNIVLIRSVATRAIDCRHHDDLRVPEEISHDSLWLLLLIVVIVVMVALGRCLEQAVVVTRSSCATGAVCGDAVDHGVGQKLFRPGIRCIV